MAWSIGCNDCDKGLCPAFQIPFPVILDLICHGTKIDKQTANDIIEGEKVAVICRKTKQISIIKWERKRAR